LADEQVGEGEVGLNEITPLTPTDCDLRGLEWMPLYGDRLFTSNTWLMAGPEARCAAMMLWWEAWKQCPAGSLPDHDRALAQLAGYGIALKAWLSIKAEAMRGWVRCSDGRLYHPIVCELAHEAWDRRVREKDRKAAYRAKREAEGASVPVASRGTDAGQTMGRDADAYGDGHVDITTQDRTGQDRTLKKEESKKEGSLTGVGDKSPRPLLEAVSVWNEVCGSVLSPVQRLTEPRKRKFAVRFRDEFNSEMAEWRDFCQRIVSSNFLTGANDRGWRADFDWVLEPRNTTKIIEGGYSNRNGTAVNGREGGATQIVREYGLDVLTPIDEQFPSQLRLPDGEE
jgi:hypothetical protein